MPARSPIRLSRRRLLAASGATIAAGAPAALAACATQDDEGEDVTPEREAELLNEVLAQQLAVAEIADPAARLAPRPVRPSIERLSRLRRRSTQELESAISGLEATPTDQATDPAGPAESPVEALGGQLEASIAAALAAVGELSSVRRQSVHRAIAEDAAALAAIRSTLGADIAPDAFVFGPPAAERSR